MPSLMPHGALFVEGLDDEHAIKQLLARHNIHIHDDECPLRVHCKGSDTGVIDAVSVAIKASGKHPVGFVVDTDAFEPPSSQFPKGRRLSRTDRWSAIRARLASVEVVLPTPQQPIDSELPSGGFISRSLRFERDVGVWLMPDNRADYGKIEDLLSTLVPKGDALFELAKRATTEALGISTTRPSENPAIQTKNERKGQLHSWLAWQEEPGMSYGHALRRKYFEHNSSVATAFVAWFKRLYGLP
ncbi:MAG: hypothetical protein IBJ18_10545 [Phycisphaerales bacterium]|nr:hypothetical protein [Phycisphaerales bacterium]